MSFKPDKTLLMEIHYIKNCIEALLVFSCMLISSPHILNRYSDS